MNAADLLTAAREVSLATGVEPWRALMVELLSRLRKLELAAELEAALEIADKYWTTDDGAAEDLRRAKMMTWAFISTLPPGEDLALTMGRRARAVLCVVDPMGDEEEISDTAEWFAAMMHGGVHG